MKDPYLSKSEAVTGAECAIYNRQDYCGFWRRWFANFFDAILLGIAYAVLIVILRVITSLLGTAYPEFSEWVLSTIIFWAYMIWFKGYRGATPGFYILGIRIISINSGVVTIKQIIIRVISSFFSAVSFGLGYIWIAIDANRQAWHDKIAGTYVIRTGAIPVRTIELPRPGLIRVKLFTSLAVVSVLLVMGLFGGVMYMVKGSDAYQLSKQYISKNPRVRQKVGSTIKFGLIIPSFQISTKGMSGEANFEINVSGDKGNITVATMLEKKDGRWQIIEADYIDKEGNYIDITKHYIETVVKPKATKESSQKDELSHIEQEKLWRELNDKVSILYQQGQYSEAVRVAREALKVAEETFGFDHPDVAKSLNNLAEACRVQGKYTEAEPLYKRSLEITEKTLGPDHPQVATVLENMAELYKKIKSTYGDSASTEPKKGEQEIKSSATPKKGLSHIVKVHDDYPSYIESANSQMFDDYVNNLPLQQSKNAKHIIESGATEDDVKLKPDYMKQKGYQREHKKMLMNIVEGRKGMNRYQRDEKIIQDWIRKVEGNAVVTSLKVKETNIRTGIRGKYAYLVYYIIVRDSSEQEYLYLVDTIRNSVRAIHVDSELRKAYGFIKKANYNK